MTIAFQTGQREERLGTGSPWTVIESKKRPERGGGGDAGHRILVCKHGIQGNVRADASNDPLR